MWPSLQPGEGLGKQAVAEGAVEAAVVAEVGGEQARPILDLIRTSVRLTTSTNRPPDEVAVEAGGGAAVEAEEGAVVEEAQTDLCRLYKRRKTRGKISPTKLGPASRKVPTWHT